MFEIFLIPPSPHCITRNCYASEHSKCRPEALTTSPERKYFREPRLASSSRIYIHFPKNKHGPVLHLLLPQSHTGTSSPPWRRRMSLWDKRDRYASSRRAPMDSDAGSRMSWLARKEVAGGEKGERKSSARERNLRRRIVVAVSRACMMDGPGRNSTARACSVIRWYI